MIHFDITVDLSQKAVFVLFVDAIQYLFTILFS